MYIDKKSENEKRQQESGCGRCSHFDLWQGQVINKVHVQDLSTS